MKKSLFILATAAIALASCNNDVKIAENKTLGNQPQEIGVFPVTQKATRLASETTPAVVGNVYPDELIMQVAAYSGPITSTTWTAGGYFDKTPFNGTNATSWKGTPARYWPLSDAFVSFLAVAGVDDDDVSFTASTYASGAVVKYTGTSFTAQTDLMYAGQQEQVTKSGNNLSYPDDVDMTFKHALAWLQFNVKAASDDYDERFAITKIVINDASQTGTYTITNTGYDTKGTALNPTGTWGNSPQDYTTADYDVPGSTIAKGSLTNAFQSCGAALLVPKSAAAAFATFTIYYTFDDKAFTFDYTPEITTLAQATKYVYNITFKLTEIEIDPVVTPWIDGGTTFIDIPTYAAGTARTLDVRAEESSYTFYVTGFAANESVTISKTDANSVIKTLTTGATTADANGVLKITFTVNASTGANNATISIDSATDSHDTAITVSQPAAS